ncbi:MAG: hypothetical protein V7752_01855 [Halopseudomonas sp.]
MARKRKKTDQPEMVEEVEVSSVSADKQAIRADKYLRLMMQIGIPLALISVVSLWMARQLGSDGLGLLFFITCPLALTIGFAYNIRYVSLAVRRQRQEKNKDK